MDIACVAPHTYRHSCGLERWQEERGEWDLETGLCGGDHHRFRERWGEDLNFRSELGTEEGVPRFLVWAILRLQGVFLLCHCLLLRQDLF